MRIEGWRGLLRGFRFGCFFTLVFGSVEEFHVLLHLVAHLYLKGAEPTHWSFCLGLRFSFGLIGVCPQGK